MSDANATTYPGRDARGLLGTPSGLSDSDARKWLRQRLFIILGGAVLVAAIVAGTWWYIVSSRYVSTDDAYVDASVAEITPQIDGLVRSVPVHDTESVKKGQVLVVIDPVDQQIAVAQAEANYGQATRRVEQYFANAGVGVAQVSSKRADLQRAQLDYKRRVALASTGAVSGDELSTAKDALETAAAGVEEAQRQLSSQQALIRGTTVQDNPEVMAARAQLASARLGLSRTVLRAPVDGIVAQSVVQIGQRVQVGTTLMSVVPLAQVYVDANFKESQLTRVRIGQPVTLTSDLYGSNVVFHGHVAGVGGGTGAAFAVIPAQNATGNWIKVVQRLPVRVAMDPNELAKHPLRVGLSMDAAIDIR